MQIQAPVGTELLLVFKAMPFIPQMNPKTGTVEHVMNVQRCVFRGPEPYGDGSTLLFDFPVNDGKTMQFSVDVEAIMMYTTASTLVAPPEKRIVS